MPELRQNLATKEWYVIASERAKRPSDFNEIERYRENVTYSEKCPFCPGHEEMTECKKSILKEDGSWLVRSVLNKYPALSFTGDRERQTRGIYRRMNAVGWHEVIIESPIHNHFFTDMTLEHIECIIRTYLDRFNAAMQDDRVEAVLIFKNYGSTAGSSLTHPHSQMIAMPIVPMPVRKHLEAAKLYYDDTGQCALCVMTKEEMDDGIRIVTKNNSFVVFCPYASGTPFESWIVPLKHNPNFGSISEVEIADLAKIMKDVFSRYYHGLKDPDFNFVVKTPPRDESNDRSFHWFIHILPKLTKQAGFELGTGMLINPTLPEKNAEFLRNVKVPEV